MSHIDDRSTTTTPAATFECLTPLCVWESGERKCKGHPAQRGQRARRGAPSSLQQAAKATPAARGASRRALLALPLARRGPAPGRGTGRSPEALRPLHGITLAKTDSKFQQLPRPHFSEENQGKTQQSHGTKPGPERCRKPWLEQGSHSSSGPAHTAPTPPATRPRRAPHAQIPLLTHSAARTDGTALPGCGTARPAPPGAPGPARPSPTRSGRTRPGSTRRPHSTARSRRAPRAHAPPSAPTTGRRGMGGGRRGRTTRRGEPACLHGAFLRAEHRRQRDGNTRREHSS